jgi:uroporphyrinogen III methyltransferase/synthase
MSKSKEKKGWVILAGAGPGDPGLLTVKATEALKNAQVVVYDALANSRLLDLAPASAKRIDAGKHAGNHRMSQDKINTLLVQLGRQGKRVVRLKGGDPFVFGRGGEEALALARAGLPFEVIPGISSGIAGPAYAGIPVTHRGVATQVTFSTGQEKKGKPLSASSIKKLAALPGTIVLFMSQGNLARLCSGMIKAGKKGSTPAAAVHKGTWPGQRCVVSTLKNLPQAVDSSGLGSPMLFVIGEVAGLRDKLAWFDKRPLTGLRLAATRASAQGARLVTLLESRGAEVLEVPTIRIRPRKAKPAMDRILKSAGNFDWLILSSANGVSLFFERLYKLGLDSRALAGAKIAAIGPATASALKARGIQPDLIPADARGEGLLKALRKKSKRLKGLKILLARAAQGRDLLPLALKDAGARVTDLALYDTVPAIFDHRGLLQAVDSDALDLVVFTSASTVRSFIKPYSKAEIQRLTSRLQAACIGPVTAGAAREAGFSIHSQSGRASLDSLAAVIEKKWVKK